MIIKREPTLTPTFPTLKPSCKLLLQWASRVPAVHTTKLRGCHSDTVLSGMWSKKAGSYTRISKCPFNEAAYIQDTIILSDLKVTVGKTGANFSPTSPRLVLLFQLPPEIIILCGTFIFQGRCPSKSSHLLMSSVRKLGLHQIEANTSRLRFTLSEEGIPEGEHVFQPPAVAVQAYAATWRRAWNQAKQNWRATLAFGSLAYLCWKWYSLQKNKCTCAHTQLLNKILAFLHRGQGKGSN